MKRCLYPRYACFIFFEKFRLGSKYIIFTSFQVLIAAKYGDFVVGGAPSNTGRLLFHMVAAKVRVSPFAITGAHEDNTTNRCNPLLPTDVGYVRFKMETRNCLDMYNFDYKPKLAIRLA